MSLTSTIRNTAGRSRGLSSYARSLSGVGSSLTVFSRCGRLLRIWMMVAGLAAGLPGAAHAQTSVYDVLRGRWFEHLTGSAHGGEVDPDVLDATHRLDEQAQSVWKAMEAARTSSSGCFVDGGSAAGVTSECFGDLRTMALAYQAKGGSLYRNADLAHSIVTELDGLYEHSYNERMAEKGNWWFWEFGIPMPLEDIAVLMHDSLTPEQIAKYMRVIDHFLPSPATSTGGGLGANGAWSARVCTLKSILLENADGKLAKCRDKFNDLMQYVSANDGYYSDGSYIGHAWFAYTGGYGMALLETLGEAFVLYAAPSPFPLDPQRMEIVRQWVDRSYATLLYNGELPYYVAGRGFGRPDTTGFTRGRSVALAAIDLAGGLPGAGSDEGKRFAKTVLTELRAYPFAPDGKFSAGMTLGEVRRAKAILADDSVRVLPRPSRSTIFGRMNKVEHNTPTFGFGISMFSTRVQNYEDAGENRHGWHQSDGMTYLFNNDRAQYDNGYWPTVDSNRLAGTTVNEDDAIPSNLPNGSSFAGGVTLGGRYSAVGFILHPAGDTITAQKAWFLFDDKVICLGAGITDTHGTPVETIVENRKLRDAGAQVTVDGRRYQRSSSSESTDIANAHWVHLRGSLPGSDIGYWFPKSVDVKLQEESRSGRWSDLHGAQRSRRQIGTASTQQLGGPLSKSQAAPHETGAKLPPVSNTFFKLWIPHGTDPTNARYQYVVLPSIDAGRFAAFAKHPPVTVLENTEDASAVRDESIHMTGFVFWRDGLHSAGSASGGKAYVTSDQRAALLIQENKSSIRIAVADPTQEFAGTIHVEIATKGRTVLSHDPSITVSRTSPTIRLEVHLLGDKGPPGRSFSVDVGR